MKSDAIDVRCFCRNEPLIAVAGRDARSGEPFVHIKSWKGDRLNAEAVVTAGTVRIRCRVCMRWHRLTIVDVVESAQEPLPVGIKSAISA